MDNTHFDIVLVDKQKDVDELGINADCHLHEAEHKRYVWTVPLKQLSLVVGVLHYHKTLADLWMQVKMQSNRARKLDKQNIKIGNEPKMKDGIWSQKLRLNTSNHYDLAAHYHDNCVKHLTLFGGGY